MTPTIVSCGSPGVDRGAMDAAIRLGLDYGVAVMLSGIGAFVDKHAEQQGRPFMNVVLGGHGATIPESVRSDVLEWIASNDITRLYVTGPSEYAEPGIQAAARDVLVWMLDEVAVEELGELTEAMNLIGAAVDAAKPNEGDQPA